MIDSHCHLTNKQIDQPAVLDQAREAGLTGLISIATDADDAMAACAMAEGHDDVWFTAGVHPSEAGRAHQLDLLWPLVEHPKCVAWGEMGLDGHWPDPPLPPQRHLFESQLAMVAEATSQGRGPHGIVIHSRKAVDAVLEIIAASGLAGDRFVFHCWTDGPEVVSRVLEIGAYVSFTGVVTYRNAPEVAAAADVVPLDRLMVETDSPYLTPEPHRGVRPNTPAMVVHVAAFLAKRRGISLEAFEAETDQTACRFYGLADRAS